MAQITCARCGKQGEQLDVAPLTGSRGQKVQERICAAYRDKYERLRIIKRKYDPTNFFRVNQNIRPALTE